LPGRRMDPVQKAAERRCELAGLVVWRLIGHGWTSSFGGRGRRRGTQPSLSGVRRAGPYQATGPGRRPTVLVLPRAFAYARRVAARWATFDCYGTLVDWNAGLGAELGRLFGSSVREPMLARYHVVEPRVQSEHPAWSYRDVMAAVLAELASEAGVALPANEHDALGRSLPGWPVFAEVPGALAEARGRGWARPPLSHSERDLIEASLRAIRAPFD